MYNRRLKKRYSVSSIFELRQYITKTSNTNAIYVVSVLIAKMLPNYINVRRHTKETNGSILEKCLT